MSSDESKPWQSVFSDEELRIYELNRRSNRAATDWTRSALLVVDVTNAFLGRDVPTVEAAAEIRTACGRPGWEAVRHIRPLLDAYRAVGRPVIYTKGTSESHLGGPTIGASEEGAHNVIVDDVAPQLGELVLEKARASAFFATPLTSYLVRNDISVLVVVGGTTSGCVRATAVDGASLGFTMVVGHEATFDRSQLSRAVTLQELDVKYATVLSSEEIAQQVGELAVPA